MAEAMLGDLPRISQESLEYVAEHIPDVGADPELRRLTLAALTVTIEAGLTMIIEGIAPSLVAPPPLNIVHARHVAALRPDDVDGFLRYYRLAHAHFWQCLAATPELLRYSPAQQAIVVRETAAFSHAFIDVLSTQIVQVLADDHARTARLEPSTLDQVLAAIAAGGTVDPDWAARVLGTRLEQPLVCAECWTDVRAADIQTAVTTLAAVAQTTSPLVLQTGEREALCWLPASSAFSSASLRANLAQAAPHVHVALGQPGAEVTGMERSRREAATARRITRALGASAPSLTAFADIALVALLTRDDAAARDFVSAELGALAARGEREARLRATVLAYLRAHASHTSAAAALGIHRNTLRQHLEAAEARRGAPITTRALELHAALTLAETLGDRILPD